MGFLQTDIFASREKLQGWKGRAFNPFDTEGLAFTLASIRSLLYIYYFDGKVFFLMQSLGFGVLSCFYYRNSAPLINCKRLEKVASTFR
ncbi:hypothetical protein IJ00_13360 [Calothrix sp. 336/3]|nr:hypothetical protein IJ00_13360 [Calothrix sp. 336/3]